jgi:chromate transporter
MQQNDETRLEAASHSAGELFRSFLRLGLTSFGGPVAHLGYFRTLFVARKRWLTDKAFVDLVALCQFLPGPASSQVAFGIGLLEAGLWGGLVAWAAFTLPSAVLMVLFAQYAGSFGGPLEAGILHGLKVVAVSVVAHAVWSMARTQAPDVRRLLLAATAAAFSLLVPFAFSQPLLIVMGGLMGLVICCPASVTAGMPFSIKISARQASAMLAAFAGLLILALPGVSPLPGRAFAVFGAFYRSGALVFGGGHVVLPLLQDAVVAPGWISANSFLAGYGAAQALPGPLFSIAAYLGALLNQPPNGLAGAAIALAGISLPGLLLVAGILPFWDRLRGKEKVQAAVRGVNATVVGILAAALYNPLWITAVGGVADALMAAFGFALLTTRRVPVLLTVALVTAAETALAFL